MKPDTQAGNWIPLYPWPAAHFAMLSSVSKGAVSPANCPRKMAGPLMVFISCVSSSQVRGTRLFASSSGVRETPDLECLLHPVLAVRLHVVGLDELEVGLHDDTIQHLAEPAHVFGDLVHDVRGFVAKAFADHRRIRLPESRVELEIGAPLLGPRRGNVGTGRSHEFVERAGLERH